MTASGSPTSPRPAPRLEAWLALRGDAPGALFGAVNKAGRVTGARLGESSLAFVLARRAKRAGVAALSPHDKRRIFVGDLLDAGATSPPCSDS